MPKIKVNDINLYYQLYDKQKIKSGHPIVFVAGLSADHNIWNSIADSFAENHTVLLFDNRGVDQSDAPNYPYTIEMMATDVAELVKTLDLGTVHFVGSSMGGLIVQELAYKYPALTKSITIANSFLSPNKHLRLLSFMQSTLALRKANAPIDTLLSLICITCYSHNFLKQGDRFSRLKTMMLNNPHPITIEGYENQGNALLAFDSSEWAGKIKKPALVITADEDLLADAEESQQMAQKIAGAQYFCFNKVGHLPHIEQPEIFYKLVSEFIDKL